MNMKHDQQKFAVLGDVCAKYISKVSILVEHCYQESVLRVQHS